MLPDNVIMKLNKDRVLFNERFKNALVEKGQDDTGHTYIYHQVSTETHHHHNEVNTNMPYSTESKLLPQKENIDMILSALDVEEKEEFLHELLRVSMQVVTTGKAEYIEALRQSIVAWEYIAEIAANPEMAKDIDETREETINDQLPGVEWRDLLRG